MQIHNTITPTPFGNGARPDHAGQAAGRGQPFEAAPAAAESAAPADTTTAAAPPEEVETQDVPGNSVAHRARNYLAADQLAAIDGVVIKNFGALVSMIARGLFTDAAGEAESENSESTETAAVTDDVSDSGATDGGEAAASDGDSTTDQSESDTPAGVDEGADPVVDLVDELLDDSEDADETV